MEVLQNDVVCTHGCAVGKLDTTQLFYLMSRGLSDVQANKLLVASFFGVLLNLLDDQKKKVLSERIEVKMRQIL